MIAERTFDVGVLLNILTNAEIFDAISEDGATVETLLPNLQKVVEQTWVSLIADNEVVGVAQFKPMFNKAYDCHIHILPEHRKVHSVKAGEVLVKWCQENMSGCLLYTNVPVFCENVRRYLLNFDFKEVGILEKAWLKNGVQNDMYILTRVI